MIQDENQRYDPQFDSIMHIDQKCRCSSVSKRSGGSFVAKNRIESDHAALKRRLGCRQSFRSQRSAKATLSGIETIRTIKRGRIYDKQPGVQGELQFIEKLFPADV